MFTVVDPTSRNSINDKVFSFDGVALTYIDKNDLSKAGTYILRAYARYDGTVGGNADHYDQYATLRLSITLFDPYEQD